MAQTISPHSANPQRCSNFARVSIMMAARTPRAGSDGASGAPSSTPAAPKSDAVQVAVRVRPLSANEAAQGSECCVEVTDSSVLLSERQFDFDAALPASTEQESVFSELVRPMVDQFFDGYNATVLAYGQTGSGKTYTMGNEFAASVAPSDRGVIPRVIENVFERVKASSNPEHFVLKLSYLEILNEEIRDLLAKSSPDTPTIAGSGLSVRGDSDRGIIVSGLSEHIVGSNDEAGNLLRSGALTRATASTSMNAQSSRSHAICTLTMEHHDVSAPEGGTETRYSKFHLVDLAGSERVRRTNSEGARFKEGVNINRGLLALGNVINALCERSRTTSVAVHVPYRDSKLTRLLQDSLGGNSKTLMIACISPADINYEETFSTLRYASRTRSIENQAVINKERSAENEVAYLKQQLEIVQLQLLQQTTSTVNGLVRVDTQNDIVCDGSEKPAASIESLVEENRTLREELVLANSAKEKWKKIADELTDKNSKAASQSS
ncbi:kinesin family member 4 isoform 2 putati [Phytophthora cinnamomi]|uniref:kinesin family member 4 isoform 2 putati n=1 Tax=Phytophthora cinnamomi TaxID=4785 RepID=UPI003559C0A9|nr:kinesin family member 4 isoform 2 putati [Phytophthora cinnamomi]